MPHPDQLPEQYPSRAEWIKLSAAFHFDNSLLYDRLYLDRDPDYVHDAWRSTKINTDGSLSDDRATLLFEQLPVEEAELCLMTGDSMMRAIYKHLHYGPRNPLWKFNDIFIYSAMQGLFKTYCLYTEQRTSAQKGDQNYLDDVWDKLRNERDSKQPNSPYPEYGKQPAQLKEVDRRIVVASMVLLEEPDRNLFSNLNQEQILLLPHLQRAIADGKAVLEAARTGKPYDESSGYARHVVDWEE